MSIPIETRPAPKPLNPSGRSALWACGLMALAAAYPASSQEAEADASLQDLFNLTVTATSKKPQTINEAPSNVTLITAQQIKEWGSRDLKDVLRRVVGYPVLPDRDEWVFAARGNVSDNNLKYLILIDGHRMNSVENFGPGQIIEMPGNLSNVKQIEIIRGPGSAVWGPDALAGVINIRTLDGSDFGDRPLRVSGRVGGNAYLRDKNYGLGGNSQIGDVQAGRKYENGEFALFGVVGRQDGSMVTQSAATTNPILATTNSYGDHPFGTYRTSLDKTRPGYLLQAKGRVNSFSVNALAFSTEVYNRHFESDQGREVYLATHKTFVEGAYESVLPGDLHTTFKASSDLNLAEYQPLVQGDAPKSAFNIVWLDRRLNASADFVKPVHEIVSLSGGVDYSWTKLGPNQRLNAVNPDSSAKIVQGFWLDPYVEDNAVGGYLMADLKPSAYFGAVLGMRSDYNGDRGADDFNFNPRLALLAYPGHGATFKLLYNRGFLRPANFQSAASSKASPVESEVMDQIDLQWLQRVGSLQLTTTLYWQQLSGFINILAGLEGGFANTGDYTSKGLEFEAAYPISSSYSVWGNAYYSLAEAHDFPDSLPYNAARVDLDGKLLSYPEYMVNLGGTGRHRGFFASPAVRLVAPTKYRALPIVPPAGQSRNYAAAKGLDTEANYETTEPLILVDLNLGYDFGDRITASVYVDNLFDEQEAVPLTIWNGTIGQYGRHVSARLGLAF